MGKIRWWFLITWSIILAMTGLFWYGVYNFVVDYIL